MANSRLCSIPDCDKPHYGLGYCGAHYQRFKRQGDPLGGGTTAHGEALRYFNDVVLTYEADECLIWPYSKNPKGYGQVFIDGRNRIVGRLVCEEKNGPPPTSKHEAAHSCGKGHLCCVNKRHMSWKTHRENIQDKEKHGTMLRGSRHGSAKLTDSDVYGIRNLEGQLLQRQIAHQYGVSRVTITNILSGKRWQHLR